MIGFGILVGIIFPFFARAFGVRSEIAYSHWFFTACIAAGILVGAVNIILSRVVIARKLRLLISRMRMVQENLKRVIKGGDLEGCTPEKCHIPVDSSGGRRYSDSGGGLSNDNRRQYRYHHYCHSGVICYWEYISYYYCIRPFLI